MAKVVKKKKKKIGGRVGGGPKAETSNLRPYYNPRMAPCIDGCPAGNDCREFVTILAQAEKLGKSEDQAYEEAWAVLSATTPLPAVCGRVCPHPCEDACNRSFKDGAVGINKVERAIGDWALASKRDVAKLSEESTGKKVAVVGAGPAGLAAAYHLARRGHGVTVFESFQELGGMLRWGIPPYRLPRDVLDGEIARIGRLGVEFKTGTRVGTDVTLDKLKEDFDAVFVAIGAHKGYKLGIANEDVPNCVTGADFLNKHYSGHRWDVGNDVVVIGGGNTAIDAASVCRRLGANTTILYRRTEAEMPAIEHEIQLAKEDGVNFEFLGAPVEIIVEDGKAKAMKCLRMELKEADSSGRPRPVPIEGSEYERPASFIIPAIAQEPDFEGLDGLREGREWIKVDDHSKTRVDGVYGGGDAVGAGLVTIALGHGRLAAEAIHADLMGESWEKPGPQPLVKHEQMKLSFYDEKAREDVVVASVAERLGDPSREVIKGLTPEQVIAEARRCMSCGKCFQCETCFLYCQDQAIVKQDPGQPYLYKLDICQGCKKCAEECPCAFLEMR